MAATTISPTTLAAPAPRIFNVGVFVASIWFFTGLLVDGWAHSHLDLSHEGFFTPYHAIFYSGFGALAAVLGIATWRNRSPDLPWYRWFPAGYGSMAAGIAIFAVGGFLDMLWHIAFGIEQDTEALYSPTHLILAVGGATIMTGPIRGGLSRPDERAWKQRFGTLLALGFFATLVTFFLLWAFGTGAGAENAPAREFPGLRSDALGALHDLQIQSGITAVIFRSLVIAGVTGFAARRLALPFGAIALLATLPSVLIAIMLHPAPGYVALSLVSGLAAGFAGDVFLARVGRLSLTSWRSRAFAFALPFIFWAVYFALARLSGSFWWSPHVIFGAPVIGGLMGLLLELAGESEKRASSSLRAESAA